MRLQVLVSTMHRTDHSLLDEMNIQCDAVVINQCDRNETEEFTYNGHSIKWISVNERGIGKSRNLAIENATADILLFADDDVIYEDNMSEAVISAFEKHSNSDVIMFNFESLNKNRPEFIAEEEITVGKFNFLRYGAFRIAVRSEAINRNNIRFSLLFGGGAKYQCGEDNLFLINCINAQLHPIAMPVKVGNVKQEESTWFKGYDEKYFSDRGALFYAMFKSSAWLYLLLMDIKSIKKYDIPFIKRYRMGLKGISQYKKNYGGKNI